MELIMSNPMEHEWIRMRQNAEMDRRTEIRAAERNAHIEDARSLKHAINGPPERRVKQTDHHKDGQAG